MRGGGRPRSRPSTARSACWSTTPATRQSGAIETRADGRRAPPVRDERLRPGADDASWCCRGCAAQRWGKIVNISSMGANFVFPGGGFYHATKYAVDAISDALRFEVKGFGVDVVDHPAGAHQDRVRRTRRSADVAGRRAARTASSTPRVGEATEGAPTRTGRWRKLGGGPETVAKAIEKAINAEAPEDPLPRDAERPPARSTQRSLMTDGMWDGCCRRSSRSPRARNSHYIGVECSAWHEWPAAGSVPAVAEAQRPSRTRHSSLTTSSFREDSHADHHRPDRRAGPGARRRHARRTHHPVRAPQRPLPRSNSSSASGGRSPTRTALRASSMPSVASSLTLRSSPPV